MCHTGQNAIECDIILLMNTDNHILDNIDKIHTTEAGAERVRRNLCLTCGEVAGWCRDAVAGADLIIGQGKNWYAYKGGSVITVNAKSFTVITAHRIKAKIRAMRESDYVTLNEFLYQAIFIPEGVTPPSREIIFEKEIYVYIKDFGKQAGDLGVVAEQNGQIIGAAWTRIIPAYGHIDNATPELAISILPEFRGFGTGARLMTRLFVLLRDNGYKQTSLSVQKNNPAVRFYERLGYKYTGERLDHANNEDYLMLKKL